MSKQKSKTTKTKKSKPKDIPKRTKRKYTRRKKIDFVESKTDELPLPPPPPHLRRSDSIWFGNDPLQIQDDLSSESSFEPTIHKCGLCQRVDSCIDCPGWTCPCYVVNKRFGDLKDVDGSITICSSRCFAHFLQIKHIRDLEQMLY